MHGYSGNYHYQRLAAHMGAQYQLVVRASLNAVFRVCTRVCKPITVHLPALGKTCPDPHDTCHVPVSPAVLHTGQSCKCQSAHVLMIMPRACSGCRGTCHLSSCRPTL